MRSVGENRWREAQVAEHAFWQGAAHNSGTVRDALIGQLTAASWLDARLEGRMADGDWLEIGIGPLGLGCLTCSAVPRAGALVAVEPLEIQRPEALTLPAFLRDVVRSAQQQVTEWHRSSGEDTELPSARFSVVAIHNVLDHVRDPAAVLREAHRVLKDGGHLFLSCDVFSFLSRLKFSVYTKRFRSDALVVRAHPFRFSRRRLLAHIEQQGFSPVDTNGSGVDPLLDVFGHARITMVLAQKT